MEQLWDWIERTGGYPGKIIIAGLVVLIIMFGITWYSNRR
jgi:hypothetical protein